MLHRIYLPQTTTGPKLVFAMHGEDIDHLIREGGMHLPKDPKYEQTSDIFFVFGATPEQVQEQFGLNEKSRSILEGWLREGPAPRPSRERDPGHLVPRETYHRPSACHRLQDEPVRLP